MRLCLFLVTLNILGLLPLALQHFGLVVTPEERDYVTILTLQGFCVIILLGWAVEKMTHKIEHEYMLVAQTFIQGVAFLLNIHEVHDAIGNKASLYVYFLSMAAGVVFIILTAVNKR